MHSSLKQGIYTPVSRRKHSRPRRHPWHYEWSIKFQVHLQIISPTSGLLRHFRYLRLRIIYQHSVANSAAFNYASSSVKNEFVLFVESDAMYQSTQQSGAINSNDRPCRNGVNDSHVRRVDPAESRLNVTAANSSVLVQTVLRHATLEHEGATLRTNDRFT